MEVEPFVLRWGIIGTGTIASMFISDLLKNPSTNRNEQTLVHKVQAIASSTSLEKAKAFSQKHVGSSTTTNGVPELYDSYEELYEDEDVDIVYIATPHALHMENALDVIQAGKHVLVEKPLGLNRKQGERVVEAARRKGVFLMEAVWTRFFPLTQHLQMLIHEENTIGPVHRVFADFGLDMPLEKQPEGSRLSDLSLGAGSLLDIGIYSLTWAHLALHDPDEDEEEEVAVAAALTFNDEGVDEIANVILNYASKGAQALCTSTYLSKTDPEFCRIEGSKGSIHVLGRTASKPSSLLVKRKGEEMQRYDFAVEGWGFFYEQDAVARAIKDGRKETEVMSWAESLRVLGVLDEVRRLGGLRYPQDDE